MLTACAHADGPQSQVVRGVQQTALGAPLIYSGAGGVASAAATGVAAAAAGAPLELLLGAAAGGAVGAAVLGIGIGLYNAGAENLECGLAGMKSGRDECAALQKRRRRRREGRRIRRD